MRKTKIQKGITLIALIITIIILLILAVVTIGSIKNSNIITYAQNAATDYDTAKNDEEGMISGYEALIEQKYNESQLIYKEGVPIPAGFYYVTGSKDEGLVISDSQLDENKADGKDGNQFVWVPVPDIAKFAKLQSGPDVNYEGVLYDFTTTLPKEMEEEDYGIGTSGSREPDALTLNSEYDVNSTNLEKAGMPSGSTSNDFKNQLQKEFNEMVASVAKYKGFYVGRYETSMNGTNPQSKYGATSATAAADGNTWYGLYALNKKYTTSSIKSSMIWGSQYDAMMIWMKNTGTDVSKTIDGKNTERTSGTAPDDKINNVYDLYGNSQEWTLEANDTCFRVCRGGWYQQLKKAPYYRMLGYPNVADNNCSSRLALYIV